MRSNPEKTKRPKKAASHEPFQGQDPAGQERFQELMAKVLKEGFVKNVHLAGTAFCDRMPSDASGYERIHPWARLLIMLEGSQRYAISSSGRRADVTFKPGDALFWTNRAWQIEFWETPCVFLGIIFRERTLRFILVDYSPPGMPQPPKLFRHTPAPISGAAIPLLKSLHILSETDSEGPAGKHCLMALLELCSRHLGESTGEAPSGAGKASRTWERVIDYVKEHYAGQMNRKTVAEALEMHPNYLSSLALKQTGRTFQHTVEGLRMDEARRLLQESSLKVERIAEVCGYGSSSYFITAFRRVNGISPSKFRSL